MQLYKAVSKALFTAHVQSKMKEEIMMEPLKFVNIDPAYTRTILDQKAAGKKLALITNSDWVRPARPLALSLNRPAQTMPSQARPDLSCPHLTTHLPTRLSSADLT